MTHTVLVESSLTYGIIAWDIVNKSNPNKLQNNFLGLILNENRHYHVEKSHEKFNVESVKNIYAKQL